MASSALMAPCLNPYSNGIYSMSLCEFDADYQTIWKS